VKSVWVKRDERFGQDEFVGILSLRQAQGQDDGRDLERQGRQLGKGKSWFLVAEVVFGWIGLP
jgi:hypothetical protein